MAHHSGTISTDTATICVFDLAALRHRKDDDGDWWSLPRERVEEVSKCNVLFISVGDDGDYCVHVSTLRNDPVDGFCLHTPSERVFIGPGEETSGATFEPTGEWGGFFVPVQGQYQKVSVSRQSDAIEINLQPTAKFDNEPRDMLRFG